MVTIQSRSQAIVTDWRAWIVTFLMLGWPAFGIVAETNLLLESAVPFVYGYLLILHAIVQDFPGFYVFWVGFTLYCFSIATLLVSSFDWIRIRRTSSKQPDRESITGE